MKKATNKAAAAKKRAITKKKAANAEADLLGDDAPAKPAKKTASRKKPATKKAAPKKKAPAKKAPAKKNPKTKSPSAGGRGKVANFNHEPFTVQQEPREGTFRAKVLGMLERKNGASVNEIIKAFEDYWAEKGVNPKVDIRLRALEMIRLLRYQNGFGFKQEGSRIHALRAK